MNRRDFRERLDNLLDIGIDDMSYYDMLREVESVVLSNAKRNTDSKHMESENTLQNWTDPDIRKMSMVQPTVENIIRCAELYGRPVKSILEIFNKGIQSDKVIKEQGWETRVSGGRMHEALKLSGIREIYQEPKKH